MNIVNLFSVSDMQFNVLSGIGSSYQLYPAEVILAGVLLCLLMYKDGLASGRKTEVKVSEYIDRMMGRIIQRFLGTAFLRILYEATMNDNPVRKLFPPLFTCPFPYEGSSLQVAMGIMAQNGRRIDCVNFKESFFYAISVPEEESSHDSQTSDIKYTQMEQPLTAEGSNPVNAGNNPAATPDKPANKKERHPNMLERFEALIEKNLSEKFTVPIICKEMGMSKSGFTKIIKELTGLPPKKYVMYYKLMKSRAYLQDHNVSDTSMALGFYDAKTFGKRFKQEFQETPSDYRKRLAEN